MRIHSNVANKILYPELSYKITGLLFKTHSSLGRFCREKQYCDFFENLLKEKSFSYERKFLINLLNPDSPKGNRADFFIENSILINFKAKNFITKEDYIQAQRYLQNSEIKLGIIVNFRNSHLKPKRVLNYKLNNS